ncbi:MAG: mucoidy inhibitor MuiA family protein [Cypionkella sp.]
MHRFLTLALLLPSPALADVILAKSHITAVTIFASGAQITRQVDFTATAGSNDLLITDLPAETQADLIRLTAPDLTIGAFALRTDRLPPRADPNAPDILAADAAVKAAEAAVRDAQAAVAAINARIEAGQAQISFLSLLKPEGAALTPESLTQLAQTIGAQTLAARQSVLAAIADLPAPQQALTDAQAAQAKAELTRAALSQGDSDYAALSVAVTANTAGQAHLTVTHFVADAYWSPVYDMTLDRRAPSLTVDRGVLVSQSSGEDWSGVDLTLSTAQPSAQSAPSDLYPQLRQIFDPAAVEPTARALGMNDAMMEAPVASPMVQKSVAAVAQMNGETVVYHYPTPVNAASGVENLRLALDTQTFTPQIEARAVPSRDQTAFLLASFTNQSTEILLPGTAYLYRDGGLIGGVQFAGLAPAQKTDLGFGAIEGLRLKRSMPDRSTGDRGFISTSTEQQESAVLSVENLTDQAWPVRVLDQVPYSEQDDLTISYTADPAATEENFDDQRGILSWQFDLPAGEKKQITLTQNLRWPEGKVLQ